MWIKTWRYPLSESDKRKSKTNLVTVRKYVNNGSSIQLPLNMSEREVLKLVFLKGVTNCVRR